jgi:tetratricopeptide (TPR) repeat protein
MKKYQIILFVALIILAAGCGSSKQTTTQSQKPPKSEQVDARISERVSALFIDGNKEKILGNFRQAVNIFRQCLSLDPNHAPSMYELARIYRVQGNINEAMHLAERAVEIDPDNDWYSLLLSSLYEYTGQVGKAIRLFEGLNNRNPANVEYMYELAMLYMKENRFADAISVYDRIERIAGIEEDISIQKQKLYLMNNQPDKAIAEIEKLISLFPTQSKYYALLAELYFDLDDYPSAIAQLEKIRELDPSNPYIHITLAEYYFKTGKTQEAIEEVRLGFANPNLQIEIKFQVLLTYLLDEDDFEDNQELITELINTLSETHPNDTRPLSLLVDFYLQDEKYPEARDALRKVLELDQNNFRSWETLLRLNAFLQDTTALLNDSRQAIELFPLQPLPWLFSGLAYSLADDYERAIKQLNSGKDLVVDDDEMLVEFLMYLGDTYNKAKDFKKSDQSYEDALEIDPDNAYVLNNYSYYLSLRKERLAEAKIMSARSLELSPDNKHYLDTYGWILYQMGEYSEARVWIAKALENNASEQAVVLEHMGDVLYKLGEKESALNYWKMALELGGEVSEFLEQKVKDETLYE